MNKPFNLEAFKAKQKALTRDGSGHDQQDSSCASGACKL